MAIAVNLPLLSPAAKARKPLWKNMGFQIIVAMILGAAVGFVFPDVAVQLKILGDIFLWLIKTAVAPLVFLCVVIGVVSAGDIKRVGKVGSSRCSISRSSPRSRWRSACWRGNLLGVGTGMGGATAAAARSRRQSARAALDARLHPEHLAGQFRRRVRDAANCCRCS